MTSKQQDVPHVVASAYNSNDYQYHQYQYRQDDEIGLLQHPPPPPPPPPPPHYYGAWRERDQTIIYREPDPLDLYCSLFIVFFFFFFFLVLIIWVSIEYSGTTHPMLTHIASSTRKTTTTNTIKLTNSRTKRR